MTYDELINELRGNIYHMKDYAHSLNALDKALGVDTFEGFLGRMFDELMHYNVEPYAVLAGEDNYNTAIEWLYDLVLNDDPNDEEDIQRFGTRFLKGLCNE